MFAFLGIVCFLRQRCAAGGRFPRGLALGSHLFNCLAEPRSAAMRNTSTTAAGLAAPSPSATRPLFIGVSWIAQFLCLAPSLFAPKTRAPLIYAHCPVG